MIHQASNVTIIAERLLQDRIVKLLHTAGATGYTIVEGSGEGHHHKRTGNRPNIISDLAIVRIEFVMTDQEKARAIAKQVAEIFFTQHPGIVHISAVEVLRPERF